MYDGLLDDDKLTLDGLTYRHSTIDSLSRVAHLRALDEADVMRARLAVDSVRVIGISNAPGQRASANLMGDVQYVVAEEVESSAQSRGFTSTPGMIEVSTRVWVEYVVGG